MGDWIRETFTSNVGWNHLETLVDIRDRMAGTTGEREAAKATRDALSEYCDDTWFDEFDIQGWERGESTVRTPAGDEECIALPRSPSADVTAELVDLGYGLPEDFEDADITGSIVLVASDIPDWYDRYLHRLEKYCHAVEAGAVGFIYKNHVEGCLPPTGSVARNDQPIGKIPAIGVSSEVGARLARRWDGDELSLSVDANIYDATSQNVHGVLGPDTGDEVFVTSHVDAHDIAEGAMDNGAGTAMVLEVARALSSRESALDKRIHFVCFGAEEVGLVGSSYDVETRDRASIRTVLNFDGVVRGRTLKFDAHGFDSLRHVATDVADSFGHPVYVTPEMGPHSDHWPYVKYGVPGYHVASKTDGVGRGWGHTHADTLDKLEIRDLREQAILLTELATHLASDDFHVSHTSENDIAAALKDQDLAESMKMTGDWPY